MANEDITRVLVDFLQRGLVISPWLMMNSESRFDVDLFTLVDRIASDTVDLNWTEEEKIEAFGAFPLSERVPKTAVYEIIASSALSIAHYKFGDFEIYHEQIMEAVGLLNQFIADYGFGTVLMLYGLVTSFENAQVLHYYGKVPEKTFNLGSWHRPWVDYSLSDELFWGMFSGNYQIEIHDSTRYVSLTNRGKQVYLENIRTLDECGYLTRRVRQLQIHNFTFYQNYSEVANEFWPNMMQLRKNFLAWSGVQPGMRVLELGCANGLFTFDAGLADLVGEKGQVVAIDPSMGMVYRANKRKEERNADGVTIVQAAAEHLPFESDSFDAVVAFNSLHFMDLTQALREVMRVIRPEGFFATAHPLKFNMAENKLVQEWMEPITKLAKSRVGDNAKNQAPIDYQKSPEEILDEFVNAGYLHIEQTLPKAANFFKDPETVVNHVIRGVGWMQEELSMVPWKAREDIINDVFELGKTLCKKYSPEERIFLSPMQTIKGMKSR